MASSAWSLEQTRAVLQLGALQATTDVNSLAEGLTHLRVDGTPLAGSLWEIEVRSAQQCGIGAPLKMAESYLHSSDLVVRYQETQSCPFRTSIHWTTGAASGNETDGDQLSMSVSIETDLLDSYPEVKVSTQLAFEEIFRLHYLAPHPPTVDKMEGPITTVAVAEKTAGCGVLYRLTGGNYSLVEMVHPKDFQQLDVAWSADGMARVDWRLFGQFLEKGVIRRARMHAALLQRENDTAVAAEIFRQFAASEAALTT